MEPIVVGPARGKIVVLLVASLGFVVGGVIMLLVSHRALDRLAGIASIAFFGACTLLLAKELVDARPRLVIDDSGVFDRTLLVGIIAWDDIVDAEVVTIARQQLIALRLRDPKKYTARLGPVHQRLVTLNEKMGHQPLNLKVGALDVDPHTLAAMIVREAEARRAPAREPYRD
jgi:hypothetical protein